MSTIDTVSPALTEADLLRPRWAAPARVHALVTTRGGGVSAPPFGRWSAGVALPGGLNLGRLSGDDLERVEANRARLLEFAGVRAAWLQQVHGAGVVDARDALAAADAGAPLRADASVTAEAGIACAVMIADCMPVLLCDPHGRAVGAAHAGWRGLAAGVIERTAERVAALAGCPASALLAYLGPSIGPSAFEVGADVRDAFVGAVSATDDAQRAATAAAFVAHPHAAGKYFADLPALARLRLQRVGIAHADGGDACTVTDRARFYSYRRDRETGRMAALIWLAP